MNLKCLFGFHQFAQLNSHLGCWFKDVPKEYLKEVSDYINFRLGAREKFYASNFVVYRCNRCMNIKTIGVHLI